jgi:hypothetical protein
MSERIETLKDLNDKIIEISTKFLDNHPDPDTLTDMDTLTHVYQELQPIVANSDFYIRKMALGFLYSYFIEKNNVIERSA